MLSTVTVAHGQNTILMVETKSLNGGSVAISAIAESDAVEFVIANALDHAGSGSVAHPAARSAISFDRIPSRTPRGSC